MSLTWCRRKGKKRRHWYRLPIVVTAVGLPWPVEVGPRVRFSPGVKVDEPAAGSNVDLRFTYSKPLT